MNLFLKQKLQPFCGVFPILTSSMPLLHTAWTFFVSLDCTKFLSFFLSLKLPNFLFIFFNWRKVTLQRCDCYCHITMQTSHTYTYIPFFLSLPPLLPSHPTKSSQRTRLGSLCYTETPQQLFYIWKWKSLSCVYSGWPHGLCSPWTSPGQNTEVGSLSLLQRIFPTQGSNQGFPHFRQILYQLSYKGNPFYIW